MRGEIVGGARPHDDVHRVCVDLIGIKLSCRFSLQFSDAFPQRLNRRVPAVLECPGFGLWCGGHASLSSAVASANSSAGNCLSARDRYWPIAKWIIISNFP